MTPTPSGYDNAPATNLFAPDAQRAHGLDTRMRAELAASLEHIVDQAERQLPGTELYARLGRLREVVALLGGTQRVDPAVFSAYYRLVPCLTGAQDDPLQAVEDLRAAARIRPAFGFSRFSADALGGRRALALYRNALDTDARQGFNILPPDNSAAEDTRACVTSALTLMQRAAPELAGEFYGLIGEVVLAASGRQPGAMRFDGVSSYQLWGALALNVDERKSVLEMLETLAHEAGHSLLFGMTIDEPLVRNNDDDLYRSPLRRDARPMDGIYHATWVSARMHYAMRAVGQAGVLDAQQMAERETFMRASRKAFENGDAMLRAHGDLSATGQLLIDGARAFMAR